MSNLTNNRLNVTATAVQVSSAKNAIQTVAANLPFLIGLTSEERITLPAIDINNKAFTEDAINAGLNNSTLIPSYVSVPNMQTDLTLFTQLDEVIMVTKQLLEKLEDTQLLAGSEAYASALTLYKLFGSAADAGMPGADAVYNQLKQRFADQGKTGNRATQPE
jgi:hypothetical protein